MRRVLLAAVATAAALAPVRAFQNPTFRSHVDLVVLNVTVLDGDGKPALDLQRDAFTVREDGRPQTISHFDAGSVPVRILVALDASGSMSGSRMAAAQQAVLRLVEQLGPHDVLAVLGFNATVFPVVGWTADRARVASALAKVNPVGATALYDAVEDGVKQLEEADDRRGALLIISDGAEMTPKPRGTTENEFFTMRAEREASVRDLVKYSETLVYAIGIGSPGNGKFDEFALKQLTDQTGGHTQVVTNPSAITPAVERIVKELKQHYVMAFEPTGKRDGKFHKIDVTVSGCRCVARTKTGFLAHR